MQEENLICNQQQCWHCTWQSTLRSNYFWQLLRAELAYFHSFQKLPEFSLLLCHRFWSAIVLRDWAPAGEPQHLSSVWHHQWQERFDSRRLHSLQVYIYSRLMYLDTVGTICIQYLLPKILEWSAYSPSQGPARQAACLACSLPCDTAVNVVWLIARTVRVQIQTEAVPDLATK